VGIGTGFFSGPAGGGVMASSPAYRESKLILTFGTNNVLSAWTRN